MKKGHPFYLYAALGIFDRLRIKISRQSRLTHLLTTYDIARVDRSG